MNRADVVGQKYASGACPFCRLPPAEHEIRDGYMHRVWLCPAGPSSWRGVFYDEPVKV